MEEKKLMIIIDSMHEVHKDLYNKIKTLQSEHVKLVNRVRELELNQPNVDMGGY